MRILVAEDEVRLARNIKQGLAKALGFAVDVSHDGEDGLYLANSGSYDLLILDLMLPTLEGEEVVRRLRSKGRRTPILILTAVEAKASTVRLLDAGADDYLSKPFDMGELIARVKALVRRSQGHASSILTVADLEMDLNRRMVRRKGLDVDLTPMEYRVLEYLMSRAEYVVSKDELSEHLYDYNWEKFSNVIEVYISGLRRKVDRDGLSKLIHTVRGHGYVMRAKEQ